MPTLLKPLREPDLDERLPGHTEARGFTVELLDHPEGEIHVDALLLQAGSTGAVEIERLQHGTGTTPGHLLIWTKSGVHWELPTRLPRRPPPMEELLAQGGGLQGAMPVLAQLATATQGDRYFHWDELRHHPPPQGLSHEQWWLAEKLSRRGAGTPLPLLSSDGSPFWFCQPPLLLKGLHEIDMQAGASVIATC